MTGTTSRALELLSLLQTHRQWSGPDLAHRLGVTGRTLRRDVERALGRDDVVGTGHVGDRYQIPDPGWPGCKSSKALSILFHPTGGDELDYLARKGKTLQWFG